MGKTLTKEQTDFYNQQGFLFPVEVFSPQEIQVIFQKYLETESAAGEELQKRFRVKAHLPFPWLCDIIRNDKLLDAVEDIIGPNILCWGSSFFAKKARGGMTRFAIDERIEKAEDLKAFDRDGYRFDKAASSETEWIFIRSGN